MDVTCYHPLALLNVLYYLEDIGIDGFIAGNDVSLDHLHHGVLQVHLALPAGHDPGVSVDLLQRQPLVWTDLDHAPQEVLTVWRDEVRDVEDAALHLEMTVVREIKRREWSDLL